MRKLMGIADAGRVLLARVQALRGEPVVEHDGRDVLVRVVDVLASLPLVARLHIPGNMLWRKPRAGETLAVVVPADANAPGGPVALYGDAGGTGAVPPWFDDKAGLYVAETVRVESSAGDVEVEVTGGRQVKLGAAATKRAAREGDAVRVTIPIGTTFTGTVAGNPATLTTTAPVVCDGVIVAGAGSNKVRIED